MKFLKPFNQLDEIRKSDLNPNLKRLIDLGIAEEELDWKVDYDEDTKSMESSDKQRILKYRSPTGAHITKIEGNIEAFQTQLDIYFSNEDKIQMHTKFSQHPGDKGRAAFQVKHNSKWHSVFNPIVSSDKAEQWLEKVEDSGSSVQPIFYYYEEFLKALPNYQSYWTMENEGLDLDEIRQSALNPNLKRLIDLGIAKEELDWDVKYDEDMRAYENTDRQATYDYESPTGDQVISVEGTVTKFETKLSFKLSDSTIYAHVNFPKSAKSKSRVILTMAYSDSQSNLPVWLTVFGGGLRSSEPTGNAKEWLGLVKQHNSAVWPIFYYCNEFLKTLNEGLNITTNEMMKPDYTRLQLFIRALRDLPIDSNIILKIRQLINNLIIDPYHNRISILAEVDYGFSDIPGISELVAKFSRPLTEALEIQPHQDAEITQMGITLANFKRLVEIGVIEDEVYRRQFKNLAVSFNKLIKGLQLNVRDQTDLDLLMSLRQKAGQDSLLGLETAGTKALLAKGLHLVSSPTQLTNGSLIFSLDSDYKRRNGWGIGFFPGPKVIRRMTPKQINIGVWSRSYGSMDIGIKHFKDTPTDVDFYNKAMLWAADNIDFEHAALYPEENQWKYYKKKKDSPAKRSESDELRVQATAMDSRTRIKPYQTWEGRLEALNVHLEASKLRLKASQLDNDEAAVISAKEQIAHIELDIANLQNKLTN